MADNTKNAAVKDTAESVAQTDEAAALTTDTKIPQRISVKLPRKPGVQGPQDEFFSVNFKNYIIRRGEYVEVPKELWEVIKNGELAEDAAFAYANEMAAREPE